MKEAINAAPSIYTINGERKYLTRKERDHFISAAKTFNPRHYAFALLLVHTGCRISEALMLEPQHIDLDEQCIRLRTLKRREKCVVWRSIPAPDTLLELLNNLPTRENNLIFPWSRSTAYRRIKDIMIFALITGIHACSRGLRHTFRCDQCNRWGATGAYSALDGAHKPGKHDDIFAGSWTGRKRHGTAFLAVF